MPQPYQCRLIVTLTIGLGMTQVALAQFTLQGPGVDPGDFRVTTLATGLNFPVGMTALADGSLLVATSNGDDFFGATSGSLVRLADIDDDGVADVEKTLVGDVPGGRLTSVRRAGDLIAVTGQGRSNPISFYRTGAAPSDALTFLGQLDLDYPSGGWLHPHSALALRKTPNQVGQYELYFQLGSDSNFATTTRTVSLGGTLGLSTTLAGDAVHRVKISDNGATLTATGHTQIATGLRNASGLVFHPQTRDFYIAENGIDGLVNVNEPHSADEINVIPAGKLGGPIADFGFPDTYEQYRTGVTVGSEGVLPVAAFQPIPMPDGAEAEGINELVFAPPAFPAALRNGLFAGFHGKFGLGGLANEENPVAFVDLATGESFHIISNQEAEIGHPDGLLATHDTLYISDMSPGGGFGPAQARTGRIYAIRSLVADPPDDYNNDGVVDAADYTVWRDGLGTVFVEADYDVWKLRFGETAADQTSSRSHAEVPEPATPLLMVAGMAGHLWSAPRARRTPRRLQNG